MICAPRRKASFTWSFRASTGNRCGPNAGNPWSQWTYVVFTGRIMKLMEDYSASQVGVTEDNYQKWWFKHQQLSFSYLSFHHETWWYHGIFTNIMLLSVFVGSHNPSTSYSPVRDMTLWGLSNQSVRIQPYFQWSILKTASKNPQLVWSTCNIHTILEHIYIYVIIYIYHIINI